MSKKRKNDMKRAGGKFLYPFMKHSLSHDYNSNLYIEVVSPAAEEIYITRVLYNNPATIVFWSDDTKSVSRCAPTDIYSPEIGLSLCILKKLGGSTAVTNTLKTWVPNEAASRMCNITLSEVRKQFR